MVDAGAQRCRPVLGTAYVEPRGKPLDDALDVVERRRASRLDPRRGAPRPGEGDAEHLGLTRLAVVELVDGADLEDGQVVAALPFVAAEHGQQAGQERAAQL